MGVSSVNPGPRPIGFIEHGRMETRDGQTYVPPDDDGAGGGLGAPGSVRAGRRRRGVRGIGAGTRVDTPVRRRPRLVLREAIRPVRALGTLRHPGLARAAPVAGPSPARRVRPAPRAVEPDCV